MKKLTRIASVLCSLGVAASLASCAGIKAVEKGYLQNTAPPYKAMKNADGQILNSQGIDFVQDYPTYFNMDNNPFYKFNRFAYYVNYDIFDRYILKPLALFNKNYIAPPIQDSLYNLNNYFNSPFSLSANILANQPKDAANDFTRILFNGIFGLGMIDYAADMQIYSNYNNFGYVLAKWGVPTGPYLMIPGYGPTYPRNFFAYTVFGSVLSSYAYSHVTWIAPWKMFLTLYNVVYLRTSLLNQEGLLLSAPDQANFALSVYAQNTNFNQAKANNQQVPSPPPQSFNMDFFGNTP